MISVWLEDDMNPRRIGSEEASKPLSREERLRRHEERVKSIIENRRGEAGAGEIVEP